MCPSCPLFLPAMQALRARSTPDEQHRPDRIRDHHDRRDLGRENQPAGDRDDRQNRQRHVQQRHQEP